LVGALRYPTGTKLAGVVFVLQFDITNNRNGVVLSNNIRALKNLCGNTTLKNVVIMTQDRWDAGKPEAEEKTKLELSPGGSFHPAIEQGAQVYHRTDGSNPDLGALQIILGSRSVIPKVRQEPGDSGLEQVAPATELSNEILKLAERYDNDVKKLKEGMQEAMDKKVAELRQELEESIRKESRRELEDEKRRTREEFKERIAEMQFKLEEDRRRSGKISATYNFRHVPAGSRIFFVGSLTHPALQRVYPSTAPHPSSPIGSTTHFTGKSMNNACKAFTRMT
jgi:hypothetical protein